MGGGHDALPLFLGHNAMWSSNNRRMMWNNPYTVVALAAVQLTVDRPAVGALQAAHVAPCTGADSQRWTFAAPPAGAAQAGQWVVAQDGHTCLNVANAATQVIYDECNAHDATPNQNWVLEHNSSLLVSMLSGTRWARWPRECATVQPDRTVVLQACNTSLATQQWRFNASTGQLAAGSQCLTQGTGPSQPYAATQELYRARVNVSALGLNLTAWVMPNTSLAVLQLRNVGTQSVNVTASLATSTTYGLPTAAGRTGPVGWVLRHGVNDTDNALAVSTCVYGGQHNASQLFSSGRLLQPAAGNRGFFDPRQRCLRRRPADQLATVGVCADLTPDETSFALIASGSLMTIQHTPTRTCLAVADGDGVFLTPQCDSPAAQWNISQAPAGVRLASAATAKCLTVAEPNPQVYGAVAMSVVGAASSGSTDNLHVANVTLQLAGGGSATLVLAAEVCDGVGAAACSVSQAIERATSTAAAVAAGGAARIQELQQQHAEQWAAFWNASSVDLGPAWQDLEAFYYNMQYMLGSASVPGQVAPGLWGPWITTDAPGWAG